MDFTHTNELISDITTLFYERKRLVNATGSTAEIDQKIQSQVQTVSNLINQHEVELTALEESGKCPANQLRDLESELLSSSKQFDRIQTMVDSELGTSSTRKPIKETFLADTQHENLDNHELLQLHERIINQQDAQLDSLADLLTRQKQIGEMISNELDVQVDLLDEVDERANATEQRMRTARNRLDGFMESSSGSSRVSLRESIFCTMKIEKESKMSKARTCSLFSRKSPLALQYTKQGSIPHLVGKDNKLVNVALEHFIDLVQPQAQRETQRNEWDRTFNEYMGYSNSTIVATNSDINRLAKDHVKGSSKGIGMSGNGNFKLAVTAKMLTKLLEMAKPDLAILGDPQLAIYNDIININNGIGQPLALSANQERKAHKRWYDWLAEVAKNTNVPLYACVSGSTPFPIQESAKHIVSTLDDRMLGYGIYLPTNNTALNRNVSQEQQERMDRQWSDNLKSFISNVPSQKPRAVLGIASFKDVVRAVQAGADIFDNSWLEPVTYAGLAIVTSFKKPIEIHSFPTDKRVVPLSKYEIILDLNKEQPPANTEAHGIEPPSLSVWQKDLESISPHCNCWTCKRPHSRAYIHHLLCVNDMLAYITLMEHNIYQLEGFLQEIRDSIEDGTFDDLAIQYLQ
ncbi:hypothetical protein HDV01_000395 [Terramyces sp. JEL0728]|nr:hypothetical protein HDV01_000395 [Terramyces sp. JEL0728]